MNWLKKLLHIHWHRSHHHAGANEYLQCRCGHRIYRPTFSGVYSPVDWGWLSGAEPGQAFEVGL